MANLQQDQKHVKSPINQRQERIRKLTSESSDEDFGHAGKSNDEDIAAKTFQKARAFFSPSRNKVNIRGEQDIKGDFNDQRTESNIDAKRTSSQRSVSSQADVSNDESNQAEHQKAKKQRKKRRPVKTQTNTLHDYGIGAKNTAHEHSTSEEEESVMTSDQHQIASPSKDLLNAIAASMNNAQPMNSNAMNEYKKVGPRSASQQLRSTKASSDMDIDTGDMFSDRPNSISVEMVWQMFKEIKEQNVAKEQFNQQVLEQWKEECKNVAADTVDIKMKDLKVEKITKELLHYRHKTDVLTDICNSMATEIEDLSQRLENVELNNAKRSIIITGLRMQNVKKEDLADEVGAFIEEALGIQAIVESAYTMGENQPKPIVAELQTCAEKREILQAKGLLKGYKGRDKVYINEFLPIATQEKRKRERKVIATVHEQNEDAEVQYTKAGLTVQGTPYRKAVRAPSPAELVNMSVQELDKILHIQLKRGPAIKKQGSIFYAFYSPATTHQQIRDIYKKLKMTQPNARHIPCAYSIPGPAPNAQDYWDDGEPGSGRVILKLIEDNQWKDCAIFVVRIYGGVKIGGQRFGCYEYSARKVMENTPSDPCPSPTGSLESVDLPKRENKPASKQTNQGPHPKKQNTVHEYSSGQRGRGGRYQSRPQQQRRPQQKYQQNFGPYTMQKTGLHNVRGARQSTQSRYRDFQNSRELLGPRMEDPESYQFSKPILRLPYPGSNWSTPLADGQDYVD